MSEIRRLAMLMCTVTEAAGFFGIQKKTFEEMIRTDLGAKKAWEEGQQEARIGLRRKQMRLADTSAPMAIFLGKQYLGQHDVQVTEISGRDGAPIQTAELAGLNGDQRKQLRTLLTVARGKKS